MSQKARAPNRRPLQFSKKIVIAVTGAVTVICIIGMLQCWKLADTDGIVEIVKAYIGYATLAFAAYSGNSAIEKWVLKRYGAGNESTNGTESQTE